MLPWHITEDVMPQILNNVTAMQASRQLGTTQMGLNKAIQRLTTGKRINNASDDAAGLVSATAAEASARTAKASVQGFQTTYFTAQASDGFLQEATNQALRLSELEGSGNATSAEYTAVLGLYSAAATLGGAAGAGTNSASALTEINSQRSNIASTMATALSGANVAAIKSEGQQSISDSIMGADIGSEMVNLTKYQILMQAGTSALSNANQSSQSVLALFR
jgi:flagellin